MLKIHDRKVFTVAVACGCVLAVLCWICYRLSETYPAAEAFFLRHPLLTGFFALPNVLIFFLLGAFDWWNSRFHYGLVGFVHKLIGELIVFSYYPAVGALIGRSKRWLVWCGALALFHAVILGLCAYVVSNIRIGF